MNEIIKIKLGDLVKDKITDYKGTVCGHVVYSHAAESFFVKPKELDKYGRRQEGCWYEGTELELITK